MNFQDVAIASFGYDLPERTVSSEELEHRLAPLYERLKLSVGRLELMSGVRERRFYPPGTRPSQAAALAGERALASCGLARERIGCLINGSVCRDFIEPATAAFVHRALGLAPSCAFFDVSNACLGFANGMVLLGSMIERGEIEAGMVVAGEDGGPLVESTIASLLADPRAGKRELKRAFASLTIGSGAVAAVLCRIKLASAATRLLGGVARSASQHSELCRGDRPEGHAGPLMETDSEALLQAGMELARQTYVEFERALGWTRADIDKVVTHQVGSAHKRAMFERLELDPARDYPTVDRLGNIGSVSLPLSFAQGLESGFIEPGENVALFGIGSGLGCLMLGVRA